MDNEENSDAYFARREHELLLLNKRLEEQKTKALAAAEEALAAAKKDLSTKSKNFSPRKNIEIPGIGGVTLSPSSKKSNAADRAFRPPSHPLVPDVAPQDSMNFSAVTLGPAGQELETLQATVRYQKARVTALQEELDRVVKAAQEREAETTLLRNDMKLAVEENKRIMKKLGQAEQELDKLHKKTATGDSRVKELEDLLATEKRHHDQDLALMRKLETEAKGKDIKLNRVLEECERLKSSARENKSAERERGQGEKETIDKLTADVKRLLKQRAELINAFKKQVKLIDVLKRQKTHLEAARLLAFTEEEFRSIADTEGVAE